MINNLALADVRRPLRPLKLKIVFML